MSERTSPHDLMAERAVLGAVLVNNDLLAEAIPLLKPRDFFRAAHALIYETMLALGMKQAPIDLITVMDALGERLDESGGPAYISSLTEGVPRSVNLPNYATIVARHAKSRAIIRVSTELLSKAYEGMDPAELVDVAGQRIFDLGITRASHDLVPIADYLPGAMELIERQANSQERLLGLSTGFHNLDKMTSGLISPDLIILAARPSMGKTALLMNMVQSMAMQGKIGAVFSLEMAGQQLALRMLASGGGIDAKAMMRGTLSEVEYRKMAEQHTVLTEIPIYVDETADMTLLEMRAKCRSLKRKRGLDFVGIDYLQLMPRAGDRELENRNLELGAISRGLKSMAKELQVPVIALSQLSRKNEDRKDKRPTLADLRDSGAIEQDADVVLLLHREEMYRELAKEENRGIAEIIIAKQRNGPIGTVKLLWIQEQTRFANITAGELL